MWSKTIDEKTLLDILCWAFSLEPSLQVESLSVFLFVITSRFPISRPFISSQDHVRPHISYTVGNGMLWSIIWRWQRHTQRQNIFRFHPLKTSWCWEFHTSSNTSGQVKTTLYLFSKTYKFIYLFCFQRRTSTCTAGTSRPMFRPQRKQKREQTSFQGRGQRPPSMAQNEIQQKITNLCGFVLKTLSEWLCLFKDFLPLTSPHF